MAIHHVFELTKNIFVEGTTYEVHDNYKIYDFDEAAAEARINKLIDCVGYDPAKDLLEHVVYDGSDPLVAYWKVDGVWVENYRNKEAGKSL